MFPLPKDFLNSLRRIPHFNEAAFIEAHEIQRQTVSIRLNPFKRPHLEFETAKNVPWCQDAFYLNERPVFTADPLFHAGCYYVQEASSMFIEYALKQLVDFESELFALDLCAAPGGKSTILSSLLSTNSVLVANEVVKNRSDVLAYNLAKWGNCNHVVTNSETSSFSGFNGVFDIVLVDAPCSGSGLFRKQPEAVNEWSLDSVNQCSQRQQRILGDIIPSLKANGLLIYSTCSYSIEENELIVKQMISENDLELVDVKINEEWGVENTNYGFRFYPYKLDGEGFFCAILRNKSDANPVKLKTKNTFTEMTKTEKLIIDQFISCNFECKVINHNNEFKLLNNNILKFINSTKNNLYFKQVGASLGEIKHNNFVPHHFLALFNQTNGSINRMELVKDEAVKYLKRLAFSHDQVPIGLNLVTYQGFGIGWAKVLGNRTNNYLPSNYAIFNKEIGISK